MRVEYKYTLPPADILALFIDSSSNSLARVNVVHPDLLPLNALTINTRICSNEFLLKRPHVDKSRTIERRRNVHKSRAHYRVLYSSELYNARLILFGAKCGTPGHSYHRRLITLHPEMQYHSTGQNRPKGSGDPKQTKNP